MLKGRQVADIGQQANIALHIIGDIGRKPLVGWDLALEDTRVAARHECLFQRIRKGFKALDLGPRQRQQIEHGAAASERLAD
jgi:hypothetical protein